MTRLQKAVAAPALAGAASLLTLMMPGIALGGDATVQEEPTEPIVAKFTGEDGGGAASVSWYFTNESPLQERQIAQTVQAPNDGTVRFLALKLSKDEAKGQTDEATYQLTVYESATRPERNFARGSILKQEGIVRSGEGPWLVFPLEEALELKGGTFYTFALQFTGAAKGNRVIFTHSEADPNTTYRWHRAERSSWVASPLSLHYLLY